VSALIVGALAIVFGSCARSGSDSSPSAQRPALKLSSDIIYDCPAAAALAMTALTGERVAHVRSQSSGYEAQLKPGLLHVEIESCYTSGRINVRGLEYEWSHARFPLELRFGEGQIRMFRIAKSSSQTFVTARDERGVQKTVRAIGAPESVVGYFDPRQQLFYNLSVEDRSRLHASIVVIDDSKSGLVLKPEIVP
jgi:hypothetical protein